MGVRPMKVDPNVMRGIANMSKKDQARLTQCIFCSNDPRWCGCTEADETEDGFCKKYIDRGLTNDSDTDTSIRQAFEKGFRIGVEKGASMNSPQEWISCKERLPEDIRPVLVTWKNTEPVSYYQHIVDKHFIGTAHYHRGKWYWYSSVTEDLLAEYGKCESEEFDEAIEAVAWMPFPEPWEGE